MHHIFMKSKFPKNNYGFTMIETIIYIFLLSFLFNGIYDFAFYLYKDNLKTTNEIYQIWQ